MLPKLPALLAASLIAGITLADSELSPDLAKHLAFEYEDPGTDLPGWRPTVPDTVSRDRGIFHSGTASAKIDRDTNSSKDFTAVVYSIDLHYAGSAVKLQGYLRTGNVRGFAGLWMRLDGPGGPVEFDNMASQQLDGTRDWQRYSVELPLNPGARSMDFGVLLQGTGTVWADDLSVTIDGTPLADAVVGVPEPGPLDRDTEFDGGSLIDVTSLSEPQVDGLALLGRTWGFLKYHHPAVTSGNYHWDYELFRIMRLVLEARTQADVQKVLLDWINGLEPFSPCNDCAMEPAGTHLVPRLDWLKDVDLLGDALSDALIRVHRNRRNSQDLYFVAPNNGVGNPVFRNEPSYADIAMPDYGYRLLAVFRFWNVVEYWFPYRNLIDNEWRDVLPEFIRRMTEVSTEVDYHRTLTLLIARLGDSHARWYVARNLPPAGECRVPAALRFVDGQLLVWALAEEDSGEQSELRIGDVVHAIDGQSLPELIGEMAKYYPASNEAARHRDMSASILRGSCGEASITVLRGKRRVTVRESRVPMERIDRTKLYQHVRSDDVYQRLSDSVAYIKLPGIEASDVHRYLVQLRGTTGLVIDIRGYPSDSVIVELGQHMVDKVTPFARFTRADMSNPGAFVWSEVVSIAPEPPYYDRKVVVLVDEWTQSHAEYTAMAFRAAGATIVGSTTAGADGNYSKLSMPGGVSGGVTGLGVFYPDQRGTQRRGIVPDVWATPTASGIRDGRDEVLEAGVRAIVGTEVEERTIREMTKRRLD